MSTLAPYPQHDRIANRLDDQALFAEWGAALARGERLGLSASPHEWAYWAAQSPELPAQAPLYPAILAFVSFGFGASTFTVRILQALAGLAAVVLVHRTAHTRWGEPTAGLAALLAALYAPWIFYEATFLRTSWLVLAFAGLVAAFDRLRPIERFDRPAERLRAVGTGGLCGLAVLLQEQFLLLAFAGLLWMARRHWAGARWVLLGILAVLGPALVGASVRAGRLVVSTSTAPFNLLIANLHDANGEQPSTTPTYDAIRAADLQTPISLTRELACDIAAHPGEFLRLLGRKAAFLFRLVEIPNNVNYYLGRRENPVLAWACFDYPTLLPLALAGFVLAVRRVRPEAPLFTFAGLYALSLVAFVPLARLRQPLALVVQLLAAAGAVEIWRRAGRRKLHATAAVGLLFFAGLLLRPEGERWIRPTDWQMAGAAWENEALRRHAEGSLASARAALVEARVRNPESARVLATLRDLDRTLRTPPPRELPPEIEILCAQGSHAAQSGDLRAADRLLRRAAELAPTHPRPWHLLANVRFLERDSKRAAKALERAVAVDPCDPLISSNLAALRGLRQRDRSSPPTPAP